MECAPISRTNTGVVSSAASVSLCERARRLHVARGALAIRRARARLDPTRCVAGLGHGAVQIVHELRTSERANRRPLGGEIDIRLQDTGNSAQGLLDMGDAGCAGHAIDAEFDRLDRRFIAGVFHGLGYGGGVRVRRQLDLRAFGGQIDARCRHAFHARERAFDMRHAGGAGHAPHSKGEARDVGAPVRLTVPGSRFDGHGRF